MTNIIPDILYHATYKPRLGKIKIYGLDNSKTTKAWDDSKTGTVYLATDPHVAASYAESSDKVPDSYLDRIIILHIDSDKLDLNLLNHDENVLNNNGDTLEYNGVIPFSAVVKVEPYTSQ